MDSRSKRPWLVVLVTAVFAILVISDALPLVRGPQGWRWALNNSSLPWWPTLVAATLFTLLWWGLSRLHLHANVSPQLAAFTLIALFLATLGLQAALLTRFHPNPAAILYERLASDQASGYFSAAQEIEHLPTFLREYPERMQTFRADPHPRSKPPGIVLLYWGWELLLARLPTVANPIGTWARGIICDNLWLATRTNAALAANVFMAILAPIFSALALFPAYSLAKRFWGHESGWLATGLVAILPGRLMFAPHMDTVYPLLALLALYFVECGLTGKRPFWGFLGGLCIGAATFMSLVNGVLAVVIGLYVIARLLPQREWRSIFSHGLAIFAGTFLLWLAYWAAFGVTMWEIYAAAAPARHDLERSYALWLVGNIYDFAIFAGLPAFLLALPQLVDRFGKKTVQALLIAFWVTLLVFNLSGTIRGEVGRIWLMLAPFPALLAPRLFSKSSPAFRNMVFVAAVVVTAAMGGRWQTTEVEWPLATLRYESAQIPTHATFTNSPLEDGITLAAFETKISTQLDLTLYWQATARPHIPYTTFIHLLDENQTIVAQQDMMPQNGQLPTTCWQPHTFVADSFTLDLTGLTPGRYTLQAGMYDQGTSHRLGVAVQLEVIYLP